ncbi:putative lipoprotein [Leptospira weilii serovar Ranarum str. ICFT]|uniref:Lipoprotein n=1 Tax=Leptospira weilii serovar Ranarum str. ICFT TaxID=1218598 RepID=N1WKW5_9LEPT|nr:hypothetical protein [Leptospira weilii]EMY79570.1 putative lipoprotein [Leptospira weilii serovar Ranarum str. ICFT]
MFYRIPISILVFVSCSTSSVYNPSILMSQAWAENTILNCILTECYLCTLKVTENPVVSVFAGTGIGTSADGNGLNASFYGPAHISLDNIGTMFVSDVFSNRIRIVDPALNVSTVPHTFMAIGVVKVDCANQRLLVADSSENQIFQVKFE